MTKPRQRQLWQVTPTRSCGGCTACCKTHDVAEVDTPSGELCQFAIIGQGCSIYNQRPRACQLYMCWWLLGKGEESDRPDCLKVVMDGNDIYVNNREIGLIDLHEVETGAVNQSRVQQMMASFLEQGIVVRYWPLAPHGIARHGSESYETRYYTPKYYIPKGMFTDEEKELFLQEVEK